MAELWRSVNRPDFDFTAGFWGFVEVVTSRRCIDWLRARRALVPVVEQIRDGGQSPLDQLLDSERAQIAERVLQGLDPECGRIIRMRLQDGLSYRRIAEIVGKSEGAVRVQMYRCVRQAQRLVVEMDPRLRRRMERGDPHETQ